MEEKTMKFYDLKGRKSFETNNYKVKTIKVRGTKRKMAVAKAPSGIKATKFLPN